MTTPSSRKRGNTAGHDILLVYRREVAARFSSKGYFVGMLLMVTAVVAVVTGLSYLSEPKTLQVAVCGAARAEFGKAPGDIDVEHCSDAGRARERTADEEIDAAVVVGEGHARVLVRSDGDKRAQDVAVSLGRNWALNQAYRDQGVDRAELGATVAESAPRIVSVDGSGGAQSKQVGAAVSLVIVLFMQIVGQGSLIAQGVVEEKSTRIIEVLLSTLTPLRLMIGKVAGIGTAAVLQIAVLVGALVGASGFSGGATGGWLPGTAGLLSLVVWFLLSFALFAGLFAAAGSLVSRPEELQSVLMPVMGLALVPVGVAAAAAGDLSASWVGVVQYLPPFSGLLMPLQAGVGNVSLLQQLLAAALMLLTTAGCLLLAARVYSNSILKIGAPVRWRHALTA